MATVAAYLIESLERAGLRHIFGIQGDYVLNFFSRLAASPLEVVNTCDEQGASFAADGYARTAGFGAVCVTYGVGGLKLANSTAQSFAERCPVLVISGAPGVGEREGDPLLHHKVRSYETQLNVFREMTVAQAVLDDARTAAARIDSVMGAISRHKRPGYIELPRDMLDVEIEAPPRLEPEPPFVDQAALNEAVNDVLSMLAAAERPLIVAGVEVHRFGLQPLLLELLERSGIPFVTGVLGKSVVSEDHPQFLGVYAGGMSPDEVREVVEDADCGIIIGALVSDLATGMFTHRIDVEQKVMVDHNGVSAAGRSYPGIGARPFFEALNAAMTEPLRKTDWAKRPKPPPFVPQPGRKITVDRLMSCIDGFLDDTTTVIAEPGDALFGSLDLTVHGMSEFVSPAYYASIGYSVPASIGVQLAMPGRRPLVLTGDGSFQMTGMELSTSVRFGLSPIVVVLNNGGYGTFRPMIAGSFNDIQPWRYADIVGVIGGGEGFTVSTEDEFAQALLSARKNDSSPTIIDVRIEKDDVSERLRILTGELKKRTG